MNPELDTDQADSEQEPAPELAQELVEEVSIDGMCGVY